MTFGQILHVGRHLHVCISVAMSAARRCMDVASATGSCYHDMDSSFLREYFPYRDQFLPDEQIVSLLESACAAAPDANERQVLKGALISGDRFIEDIEQKKGFLEKHQAVCVEMEGAAVAHVAFVHAVPFGVLRIISDSVEGDGLMEYYRFKPIACALSSEIVCLAMHLATEQAAAQ